MLRYITLAVVLVFPALFLGCAEDGPPPPPPLIEQEEMPEAHQDDAGAESGDATEPAAEVKAADAAPPADAATENAANADAGPSRQFVEVDHMGPVRDQPEPSEPTQPDQPADAAEMPGAEAFFLEDAEDPEPRFSRPPAPDRPLNELLAMPLNDLAQLRGITYGAGVQAKRIANHIRRHPNSKYLQLLNRDMGIVTAVNSQKFGPLSPAPRQYNWNISDLYMDYVEEQGHTIRTHASLWFIQLPQWLTTGNYTSQQIEEFGRHYIQTFGQRYRGRIDYWDVVNEAIDEDQPNGLRPHFWFQHLGPHYIEKAYRWAHEADPNAKLVYNDYAISGDNRKTLLAESLVSQLLERDVPIHVMGFQGHYLWGNMPSKQQMIDSFRKFTRMGLEVHITELDIAVLPMTNDQGKPLNEQQRLERQAEWYRRIFEAAIAVPGVTVIQTWGMYDGETWVQWVEKTDGNWRFNGTGQPLKEGEKRYRDFPLLWDRQYQPKPALAAVKRALATYNHR